MIIWHSYNYITLKVQDIHYLFSKSIPFIFFVILFFKVPMWSTRFSHPKVTKQKGANSKSIVGSDFRNFQS